MSLYLLEDIEALCVFPILQQCFPNVAYLQVHRALTKDIGTLGPSQDLENQNLQGGII